MIGSVAIFENEGTNGFAIVRRGDIGAGEMTALASSMMLTAAIDSDPIRGNMLMHLSSQMLKKARAFGVNLVDIFA